MSTTKDQSAGKGKETTRNRASRSPLFYVSLASLVLIVLLIGAENFSAPGNGLGEALVFAPQHGFGVLPLLLLVIALFKRRFKLLLLNGLALWCWAQFLLGWNVPFSRLLLRAPRADNFRVMTYNVQRGERGLAGLFETVARARPDIVCFQETQEMAPKTFDFPRAQFRAHWRTWGAAHGGDVMTISRFPLVSQRTYPLSGERRVLETVWQTPRGKVRVLNVHIAKSSAEKQLQDREFAAFFAQIAANARAASQMRLEQIPNLETAIAQPQSQRESRPKSQRELPLPLIVAGDFNTPPRGHFYRALTALLSDAWMEAGWGYKATFPSSRPLLGIDHIFLRGARATYAQTPFSKASDHLPLVADVVLDQ